MKQLDRKETVSLIRRIVSETFCKYPEEDGTLLIGAVVTALLEESIKRS